MTRVMVGRTEFERTPDGYRPVTWRRVDAPAPDVWDVLVDREAWGPTVTAVECDRPRECRIELTHYYTACADEAVTVGGHL